MNTENIKTNEPHRFRLSLADKRNLKNPNKNIALNQHTTTINLKFLLQLEMIFLICLMVLILLWIFKIILNLSSK